MMYNIPVHLYLRSNLTAGARVAFLSAWVSSFERLDVVVERLDVVVERLDVVVERFMH